MKPAVKLLSAALLFSLGAMNPLVVADRFAPAIDSALDTAASGVNLIHALADARSQLYALARFSVEPATRADAVQTAQAPKHRAWMTLVAGIGLIAMLLGRIRRRCS